MSNKLSIIAAAVGINMNKLMEQSMYPSGKPSYLDLTRINIHEEYKLIKQKKSKLSSRKRKYIISIIENN